MAKRPFEGKTLLIVGLGMMGGSYAMALRNSGCRVCAVDTDAKAIDFALARGLIAGGGTDADAELPKADIVILGLYPSAIVPWLEQHAPRLKPGAMVTDMAGVKSSFLARAQALMPPGAEFISTHPMAGREVSGVENADGAIFQNANFIITPTEKNTQNGMVFADNLAKELDFALVTVLAPEEHDAMIGYVSQLAHVIALCLMNANGDERLAAVTGDSFRDLTRIANFNAPLWGELFSLNKEHLLRQIDVFSETLCDFKNLLETDDKEGMMRAMEHSTARRKFFNKPDGG